MHCLPRDIASLVDADTATSSVADYGLTVGRTFVKVIRFDADLR